MNYLGGNLEKLCEVFPKLSMDKICQIKKYVFLIVRKRSDVNKESLID